MGQGGGFADSELEVVGNSSVGGDGDGGLDGKEDSVSVECVKSVAGTGGNGSAWVAGSTYSVWDGVGEVDSGAVDGDGAS